MVDAFYIIFAIIGIDSLIEKARVKPYLKYFGALVLFYFGLEAILGSVGIHLLPAFHYFDKTVSGTGAFVASLILTASNPLTILFWTGVFSTKIVNEGYHKIKILGELKRFNKG